jgi:hypothetical protein
MKHTLVFSLIILALSVATGCKKKKNDDPSASTDNVLLKIEHVWQDSLAFTLETDFVHPVTGDSLHFTTFRYYLSNIRLKKADGSWWTQPNSYFLLDLSVSGAMPTVLLSDVPYGEYTDIEYVLGVDSTHNVSGAQSGDLSPSLGMFWNWNTGYIMLKAEGLSPEATAGSFAYHLGGFSGPNSVVTTRTHTFTGNSLSVTGNGLCQIHLSASPETLWSTIGSVSTLSGIHMPGANAKTVADDFYGSFEFEHIHE